MRVHCPEANSVHAAMQRVCEDLASLDEQIAGWSLETYHREIERYGGAAAIAHAESIFCADSAMVIRFLQQTLPGPEREELRPLLGLASLNRLMDDFQLSDQTRERLLHRLRTAYRGELGGDRDLERSLSSRFRIERPAIEGALKGSRPEIQRLLELRCQQTKTPIAELRRLDAAGRLNQSLESVIESILHLSADRMFPLALREHELLAYDFLARMHRSAVARARRQGEVA